MTPSHTTPAEFNLLGQRIGEKGRQVRDRLLVAARTLMEDAPTTIPTLTAITAAAGVQLTIIYRYYPDVGALLIDAMRPLQEEMAPIEALIEEPWPKGKEYHHALGFAKAHFEYWRERKGALFVRNSLAERGDIRFITLRTQWALPLFHALADKLATSHGRSQIDKDLPVAGILISGMERTTTLALQNLMHSQDVAGPNGSGASTSLGDQPIAIAQLITTLLRHDSLQN